MLCAQQEALTFAAARGAGKVLVIDSKSNAVLNEITVGLKPNGLAWNPLRKLLLVADVEDYSARLIAPVTGSTISKVRIPERPRWCVYDTKRDRFLVNVRDPAGVAMLNAYSLEEDGFIPVSATGPHGLDIDHNAGRAYVACDEKAVVSVNLRTRQEEQKIAIAGEPDVIWHNAMSHLLYCAIANPGVIDLIDTSKMELVDEILTEEGTHTLAFDNSRRRLYVFMPKKCQVAVYNEVNVH